MWNFKRYLWNSTQKFYPYNEGYNFYAQIWDDGQTIDVQMNTVNPVYPHNFVAWGIIKTTMYTYLLHFYIRFYIQVQENSVTL